MLSTVWTTTPAVGPRRAIDLVQELHLRKLDSVEHCLNHSPCRCTTTGKSTTLLKSCTCGITTVFCAVYPFDELLELSLLFTGNVDTKHQHCPEFVYRPGLAVKPCVGEPLSVASAHLPSEAPLRSSNLAPLESKCAPASCQDDHLSQARALPPTAPPAAAHEGLHAAGWSRGTYQRARR